MNWFYIALINPVAHALVNHIDKFLLSKYLKGGSVGTLVLFSSLFSIFALPVLWLIDPGVLASVSVSQGFWLSLNGAFLVVAIICYLYALESDEASYVAPLFQFVPVFTLIFGYWMLNETINATQTWAMIIIVLGGVVISLQFEQKRIRMKMKTFGLMFLSSILYALNLAVFKLVAGDKEFTTALFWDLVGKVVFGIFILVFISSYRKQFFALLRKNSFRIIGLNSFNEILALIGQVAIVYAALLAPITLVQSVSSVQPLFVFLIGLVLTLYFPKISVENLNRKQLIQKIVATVIIITGAVMLNQT